MRAKYNMSLLFLCILLSAGCAAPEDAGNDGAVKDFLKSIDGEPVVPRTANRLYISPLRDRTGDYLPLSKLSIRLKESVNSDGRLVVVQEKDRSDLLLEVSVNEYAIQNIEFDGLGQPVKKRIRIVAGASLYDMRKKRPVFSDPLIQAFRVYSDTVPPVSAELQVLDSVIDELARRITAKTVSGWYTQYMNIIEKGGR